MTGLSTTLRTEAPLLLGAFTTFAFLGLGETLRGATATPLGYALLFLWLFGVMLWLAFSVVRHADGLAVLLGEPYGTLILTLSVISIEVVMIAALMLTGDPNPTLARDTLFSVLMIVLNGMVGLALIVGALRHNQQVYNLKGASAYLTVLIPMAGLGIILPRYTPSAPGGQPSEAMAVYITLMSLVLYGVCLSIQTLRHRKFFVQPPDPAPAVAPATASAPDHAPRSLAYHAVLLPLTMLPIVLLSKKMAGLVEHGIAAVQAPQALAGFLVAVLVLSPEGMAAIRAAAANRLQRAMNIALGSALSTIGLTIPAVLAIGLLTGRSVELGLEEAEGFLLLFTLLVAMVNFNTQRTNVLQGLVHLTLFATYVVLLFE